MPRHRGVARAAAHAQPERRGHLLRHRRLVDRPAVLELDPLAAALVDREVAANGVGMLLAQPLEAEAVADLLVGGRREDQVAARPEALARERRDRDGVRRDLRSSCRARRVPRPCRRAARPRTAAPTTRPGRRARRRCGRGGGATGRRRRGGGPRGSRARAPSRSARTRRRSPRGSRAGARPPPSRCPAGSSCRRGSAAGGGR